MKHCPTICRYFVAPARQKRPQSRISRYVDDSLVAEPTQKETEQPRDSAVSDVQKAGLEISTSETREIPPWKCLGWRMTEQTIKPQKMQLGTGVSTLRDFQQLLGEINGVGSVLGIPEDERRLPAETFRTTKWPLPAFSRPTRWRRRHFVTIETGGLRLQRHLWPLRALQRRAAPERGQRGFQRPRPRRARARGSGPKSQHRNRNRPRAQRLQIPRPPFLPPARRHVPPALQREGGMRGAGARRCSEPCRCLRK